MKCIYFRDTVAKTNNQYFYKIDFNFKRNYKKKEIINNVDRNRIMQIKIFQDSQTNIFLKLEEKLY